MSLIGGDTYTRQGLISVTTENTRNGNVLVFGGRERGRGKENENLAHGPYYLLAELSIIIQASRINNDHIE